MNDCYRQTSQCRINWKLSTRVHASHSIETSAVLLVRLEACAFICNLVSITLWILHIILCGFRSHYMCQQTTHGVAKICVEISNERESSIWTQTWRKTHTGKESSIRHLKYLRQNHSFVFIFRNSAAHYVDFTSIFPSVYKNRAEKTGNTTMQFARRFYGKLHCLLTKLDFMTQVWEMCLQTLLLLIQQHTIWNIAAKDNEKPENEENIFFCFFPFSFFNKKNGVVMFSRTNETHNNNDFKYA